MSTAELEALRTEIERITEETKTRRMKWSRSNPTTFIWTSTGTPRVTTKNYVFSVLESPTNNVKLSVNTTAKDYTTLREPLEKLFDTIAVGFDQEALDFLKQVMGRP